MSTYCETCCHFKGNSTNLLALYENFQRCSIKNDDVTLKGLAEYCNIYSGNIEYDGIIHEYYLTENGIYMTIQSKYDLDVELLNKIAKQYDCACSWLVENIEDREFRTNDIYEYCKYALYYQGDVIYIFTDKGLIGELMDLTSQYFDDLNEVIIHAEEHLDDYQLINMSL